jgi:hypothetical protein
MIAEDSNSRCYCFRGEGHPILLILAIILLIYGKRFQIPVFNRLIPFLGIVAFLILIGDPFGYFSTIWVFRYNYRTIGLIGIYTGITLSILTVATTVIILKFRKSKDGFSL